MSAANKRAALVVRIHSLRHVAVVGLLLQCSSSLLDSFFRGFGFTPAGNQPIRGGTSAHNSMTHCCRHFLVALTWPRNIVLLFHAALSEQVGGHDERARALDLQQTEWRGENWEGGRRG
jgi:hypothetical protein